MDQAVESIIDLIYEAAANPEIWEKVLQDLTSFSGGMGGVLFSVNAHGGKWISTPVIHDTMQEFVNAGWILRNPRVPAAMRLRHPGFIHDYDMLTDEQMDNDPVYRDFLRPRNAGWAIGTLIVPTSEDSVIVSFERAYDRGPVPNGAKRRLDPLRPHIARSAMLSARLGLEKARGIAEALAMIGLPAVVTNNTASVVASNALFDTATDLVLSRPGERFSFRDTAANAKLVAALAGASARAADDPVSMSFPVAPVGEGDSSVAHVIPLVRSTRDVFSRGDVVVLLASFGRAGPPASGILETLFDLTPREATLARAIIAGQSLEEAARSLNIAISTARVHLKGVFQKTGVDRQASLVSKLSLFPM